MKNENWVTEQFETDLALAYQQEHCESDKDSYDIEMQLHLAHVEMLLHQKILSQEEAALLLKALLKAWRSGPEIIPIHPGRADLYSNLEDWVVDEIGIDVGGKFHIGRSRNDMNCNLSRMMCRAYLIDFALSVCSLIQDLLEKADGHVETVMPGYTHHSQHAQPTTMGHYLIWGVDSFLRDLDRAAACYDRLNHSSMGAAALCTTGFPISREFMADALGFDGIVEHSIDAAGSRDFMLDTEAVLSIFQTNLNRLTELLLVWNIREIGIVRLARKHCSYSSIMPQKVNPVGVEMVRHAAAVTYGNMSSMFVTLKGTTPGNGREPSYLDGFVMESFRRTIPSAAYVGDMVREMTVNKERCLQLAREGFSTMTELADDMVRNEGISFYMAHKIVSHLAQIAVDEGIPCEGITGALVDRVTEELFGRKLGMTDAEVKHAINPVENVMDRKIVGGPAFEETQRMLKDRRERLAAVEAAWKAKKAYQMQKMEECVRTAEEIIQH